MVLQRIDVPSGGAGFGTHDWRTPFCMSDEVQTTQENTGTLGAGLGISRRLQMPPQVEAQIQMRDQQTTEAVITVDATGRYVHANATALELLRVPLAELRAPRPDRFAIRPPVAPGQAVTGRRGG